MSTELNDIKEGYSDAVVTSLTNHLENNKQLGKDDQLVELITKIIVSSVLRKAYEEGYQVPEV